MIRHLTTLFLILSVFIFPFWVTAVVGILAVAWFPEYYELVGISFLSDILYAGGELRYHNFAMVTTVLAVVLVFVVSLIKIYFFRER